MTALTKTLALAATVAAVLGAACTERPAQTSAAREWPSFQEADKDGNGGLDSQEAASIAGLNFSAADSDYDGKISESEYETALKGVNKQAKGEAGG